MKKIVYFASILCGGLFAMDAAEAPNARATMGEKYPIVVDYLKNEECTAPSRTGGKQVVWRVRSEDENIRGIMLHYTVCRSVEATKRTYLNCGVSAHYTIAKDGVIYGHVSPENVAFHAGTSAFRGMTGLNRYFLGIEHVNPGYKEDGVDYNYDVWGRPVKIEGDSREWFAFDDAQFKASASFTAELQKKYGISGSLVITHADAAIGRKSDIGPMYNYKRAFVEFGAGFYPAEAKVKDLSPFKNLESKDYVELIKLYGYQFSSGFYEKDLVKAFQMHFSQTNISGNVSDDITRRAILNLCVDYAGYVDPYTHTMDREFADGLKAFCLKHSVETAFAEYI